MHAELLRMASELAGRQEPFVLAVVVRRQPASSAQAGDMALITAAGVFHGWLGGSCTQPTVVREARRALADGTPRLLALSPDPEAARRPGVAVFPMTCHSGGSVEIYLDPILPASRLVVFGVSPIARALVRLGKAMGYSVFAVDTALTAAEPALFPEADRVLTVTELAAPELAAILAAGAGGAGNAASSGPPGPQRGAAGPQRGGCFAVVATMGERDEEAIRAALAMRPAYLGVVASARRFAQVRRSLLARGIAAAALDSIRSPAGVAIGAQAPEEIAVSVLAEIVARRHATTAAAGEESMAAAGEESAAAAVEESVAAAGERSVAAATRGTAAGTDPGAAWTRPRAGEQGELAEVGEAGVEGEPAGAAAAVEAVDPICGMTVEVAGARHTAEAGGRTWYFCCGGCRERFLAAPERFTAAPEPAGELPRLRSGRTEGAA